MSYEPLLETDEYIVSCKKKVVSVFDVYLSTNVEPSEKYLGLADIFRSASKNDKVVVHLANSGGSCHGCIFLVNAMRDCEAPIDVIVEAPCYSAGACLALAGNSLEMRPNTFLMFHNYASVTGGKGAELKMSIHNAEKWIHTYFKDIHSPFLTDAEIKMIENDKDVYVHAGEKGLKARIRRHFK